MDVITREKAEISCKANAILGIIKLKTLPKTG